MSSNTIYTTIKSTVRNILPDARILLFGSHARGDYSKGSDFDLLIILPEDMTKHERLSRSNAVHKALIQALHAPFDLLLYSEEEIRKNKELPGHIVRTAIKEGIVL